jgi:hypothetical protein
MLLRGMNFSVPVSSMSVLLKHWCCGFKSYSRTFGNIFWCYMPVWVEHWIVHECGDLWCFAVTCEMDVVKE